MCIALHIPLTVDYKKYMEPIKKKIIKKTYLFIDKIVFTFMSLAMLSAVVGIFGGMIFESVKILVIGLGLLFLFLCLIMKYIEIVKDLEQLSARDLMRLQFLKQHSQEMLSIGSITLYIFESNKRLYRN